jgi:hypothetical protein
MFPHVQLTEAGIIEDVFSLCFGGVSGGGALLMGDVPLPPGSTSAHADPIQRCSII